MIQTTPYAVAKRLIGLKEIPGAASNPLVLAMLQLDAKWVTDDATHWCSAFVNFIAYFLGCQRSKSLAARSWLAVGQPVSLEDASPGMDVVILKRGTGPQPGPDVVSAPGHVGFFGGLSLDKGRVKVLGGNQADAVSEVGFPSADILGIRRLSAEQNT